LNSDPSSIKSLIEATNQLAKINNEQGIAITVMSYALIVLVIAFFALLFKVLREKKSDILDNTLLTIKSDISIIKDNTKHDVFDSIKNSNRDKSDEILKKLAEICNFLQLMRNDINTLATNSTDMRESLKIHIQQIKFTNSKVQEIVSDIKSLLKGVDIEDGENK